MPVRNVANNEVASDDAEVELLAANPARVTASVFNNSTAILYLKLGLGAALDEYTIKMAAGSYYEMPAGYKGAVTGIWSAVNGFAHTSEFLDTPPVPLSTGNVDIDVTDGVGLGDTLIAEEGDWSGASYPLTYSYQWTRDGDDIAGATFKEYTLTAADAGLEINCEITATNSSGATTVSRAEPIAAD